MALDIIDLILPNLVERTKADAWFDGIEIMAEDRSDFLTKIKQGLGYLGGRDGKIGAVIVWMEPTLDELYPNTSFGPMQINVTALLIYDPLAAMNTSKGVGVKPMAIVRRLRTLKHYAGPFMNSGLELDRPFMRPAEIEIEGVNSDVLQVRECRFLCREADQDSMYKVPLVTFDWSTGQMQLACADGAASIYYTLDGSFPRLGNSAAVLYTAPVTVAPGTAVRAAAYRSGCIPSNDLQETAP